jgi:TldD protein
LIDHGILTKALKIALGKNADFADVFVERATYNWVISEDKRLRTAYSVERGVGIRVVADGRTYYATTNSYDEADILRVAAFVHDAARSGTANGDVVRLQESKSSWPFPFAIPPSKEEIEPKVEIVKRAEDRAWSAPHAIQATISFRDNQRDVVLASSLHDSIIEHSLGLTEFSVTIVVEKNGRRESVGHGRTFYAGLEALSGEHSPEHFSDEAAKAAALMLIAKDCPRGEMPVVFAPGDNGILFHESCGHGMEADLVEKGSTFTGLLGKEVASPLVTLIDDGTIPGYGGSFEFDDEGTPSQKTVLVENGILRNYMHSAVTAKRFNAALTGSARRESFAYPPIPRMRNTYILAGRTDPQDIIKGTKRGLYAILPGGGGQVNVFTGEFITSVKLGYMIENGQITYPVKGASIIGRGIDALRDIDMVGSDLKIEKSPGRCGKGQDVPVGIGMPTVRVKMLTVGGTGDALEKEAQ